MNFCSVFGIWLSGAEFMGGVIFVAARKWGWAAFTVLMSIANLYLGLHP